MKAFDALACRAIAAFLATGGSGYCLTSGPGMPEYTQFEQVDATDLVSLSTGNFTWSLPVLTVPGPALGFPLVLSYHAGINQKEEASWVGLGWNLQAGAITRQVNKLADDFRDVPILETITSSKIHGWTASIGYDGATVGITYHSLEGYGGFVGYNLLQQSQSFASLDVTAGIGSARGMTGVSLGVAASKYSLDEKGRGVGAGAGLSVGMTTGGGLAGRATVSGVTTSRSLGSVGVSLSQHGGFSPSITTMGASFNSSMQGNFHSHSNGLDIIVPTPVGVFSAGFSQWSATISGYQNDHYYGFLYDDKPGMGCTGDHASSNVNCHNWDGAYRKRQELIQADRPIIPGYEAKLMKTAEDVYVVTAQGVSGVFKPARMEDGDYMNTLENTSKLPCDFLIICDDREKINRTKELDINRNLLNTLHTNSFGDVYWRFVDDAGGAEYTIPSSVYSERDRAAFVSQQSKKIKAKFDSNGKIKGFDIVNPDGAIYSFDFPLYNGWELKKGYQNGSLDTYTSQEIISPYAYAWLLTSIKSLDYLDWTHNGVTNDDVGGWVKFLYGDGTGATGAGKKPVQYWTTPFYDPADALYNNSSVLTNKFNASTGPNPQTGSTTIYDDDVSISNDRSSATGLKEIAYLQSVETPTHRADFTTVPRLDNKPFNQPNLFDITGNLTRIDHTSAWFGTAQFDHVTSTTVGSITSYTIFSAISMKIQSGVQVVEGLEDTRTVAGEPVKVEVELEYFYGTMLVGSCSEWRESSRKYTFDYTVGSTFQNPAYSFITYSNPGCATDPVRIKAVRVSTQKGISNKSRVLQSIKLYDKFSTSNQPLNTVSLGTDYSLSPFTPNSDAVNQDRGRLTLKTLTIGDLPPYQFNYSNNPAFQEGVNGSDGSYNRWVPWETGDWDRWGNRCNSCSDGYHEADVPFKNGVFRAAAWNLDRIESPSGSQLSIKYGPKKYNFVGNEPLARNLGNGVYEIPVTSGGPEIQSEEHVYYFTPSQGSFQLLSLTRYFHVSIKNIRKKLADRGLIVQGFRFQANTDLKLWFVGLANNKDNSTDSRNALFTFDYDRCKSGSRVTCVLDQGTPYFNGFNETFSATQLNFNDLWFAASELVDSKKPNIDYKIYAQVTGTNGSELLTLENYADGAVVTDLDMREPFSNTIQSMHYEYANGVTASIPSTFSDYNDAPGLHGRGYEFYVGNPGVTYSQVTTTINGKNKVGYFFLTPKDMPTSILTPPNNSGSNFLSIPIVDMSALWGGLWKKEEYPDGSSAPIRTTYSSWAVNFNQMPTNNANWDNTLPRPGILQDYPRNSGGYYLSVPTGDAAYPTYKPYFGQQQSISSHRFFGSAGCYVSSGCPQTNIHTTQVVTKRIIPSLYTEEVVQEGLSSKTYSYDYDFFSGRPLKIRKMNTDNSTIVVETEPAYYRYATMGRLNALTQDFSVSKYFYPASARTDFLQSESPTNAIGSEFTTWRPYTNQDLMVTVVDPTDFKTFRKHKSYVWKADLNLSGQSLAIPDDRCLDWSEGANTLNCNDLGGGSLGSKWFLSEQVNKYDAFSHATDVTDQRGINQTVLFGYNNSLPVAFIRNTPAPLLTPDKTLQGFYESFEGNDDYKTKLVTGAPAAVAVNWKTGKKSLEVKNGTTGTMACFDLGILKPNLEYQASAWYFDATDGSNPTDANATRPGIFLGKEAGCASEYHPNGVSGGSTPVGIGDGLGATGSRTWKRISTIIKSGQCSSQSALDPTLVCIYASKGATGRSVLYDELRVRPGQSQMSTNTYDEKGRMNSTADEREIVTSFEYDIFGNLSGIRNDDGVLVSDQFKQIGSR